MTEDRAPARHPDEDRPKLVEQTATVDGSDNITVLAGGDAQVTVQQPAAAGTELVKYLAPSLLAALLVSILGESLGLGGKIVAALAVLAWVAWAAARDTYLRMVQRLGLPVITAIYTAALIALTALPDIPKPAQFAIPAICWTAAAVIIVRLTETERKHRTVMQYAGAAVVGFGVVGTGLYVDLIRDGHTLFGVAMVGVSVTGISLGVAVILERDTLIDVVGAVGGVAMIGFGVVMALDGQTLVCVAAIGIGVATTVRGVAALFERDSLEQFAVIGLGVAVIGTGIEGVLDENTLYGAAMIGGGVATTVAAAAALFERDSLKQFAVIGIGVALTVLGVNAALNGDILFGAAGIGAGVAMIGIGVAWKV
ncbi:hypothetical protein [Nocardia fluminea]|uniref:hypothetical protein n=1 Tax=Nocardia fluminea TaxID=134984 RepID=UPI0037BB4FC8